MNDAKKILELVGGEENVTDVYHCMTRLRFELNDESKFNEEELKKVKAVKGINKQGSQYQLIIGAGVVDDVYAALIEDTDLGKASQEDKIKEMKENAKIKSPIQKFIGVMGDVFIPILPAIITAGILMGFRSLFVELGVITPGTTIYALSQVLTDTAYQFLPVLIAWSSMKRFGGDPVLGIVIGLMMVNPLLPARAAIARGTAEYLEFFGLNLAGFQGTVLPAFFLGMLGGYTYKFSKKYIPSYFVVILVPVITTLVCLIAGLILIGPVFSIVENVVLVIYEFILKLPLGIGGLIAGFAQQFLVITGLHHALIIIDLNFISDTGLNPFIAIRNAGVFGQAGATLSFAIFAANKELRTIAGSSTISAVMGITEPAIYGVNLVFGRPFLYGAIGSGIGAMFGVLVHLQVPGTVNGIPGFLQAIGDPATATFYILQSIISLIIPLILTALFIRKNNGFVEGEHVS